MKNKVSVVIATRNRSTDLKHCLGSLAGQLVRLDELVVVDNQSTDETKLVVENFAAAVKFPVRYVKQTKVGYPHVYNRGLKEASGDWVAFIDDDCVASPRWFMRIKFLTNHFPDVAVILGKSGEYFNQRVLSLTKSLIDEVGKIGAINGWRILDHEILDSKNIVYNKNFLKKHHLKFDVSLLNYGQGASEDCDLGMQIAAAKGLAIYDKRMEALHKDPSSLIGYYQKTAFTLFNHLIYERKWSGFRNSYRTKRSLFSKVDLFTDFVRRYQLSYDKSVLVLANLALTFVTIKFLRIWYKAKISRLNIKPR